MKIVSLAAVALLSTGLSAQVQDTVRTGAGTVTGDSLGTPPAPPSAGEATPPTADLPPLFQDLTPLRLIIEADFSLLLRDRSQESEEHDGRIYVVDAEGGESSFPLEIKTRGRFRLQRKICPFPPLRLDVPRDSVVGSVLEGQDKLKLVTHCRDDRRHAQNVVKEYLVYRIYNLITDLSFGARLARVTYVDTSGQEATEEHLAFLIEAEEELAERLGGEVQEDGQLHPSLFRGFHTGRLNLFQYMVGNTDYSIYGGHNVVVVRRRATGELVPVPYDFDWTGVVNAPYARPDARLRTRNVRQRVYRGLCRGDVDHPALYQEFLALEPEVDALIRDEALLDEETREDVADYLKEFWETLSDPDRRRSRIEEACRPA